MPLLHVHLLAGREPALKAELVRELTDVVHRTLDADPERITVLLTEHGSEDWSVAGRAVTRGEAGARD
ncbi:tautomerase family protein [Nocardioides pyridinolyticus]